MKRFFGLIAALLSVSVWAGDTTSPSAKAADAQPGQIISNDKIPSGIFVAGQLNPGFHGRGVSLEAKVLEIRDAPDKTHLLKLELTGKEPSRFWATTFVPLAKDEVKIGGVLMFKGYIASTDSLDSGGRLRLMTEGSLAVLQARTIETPK